MYKYIDEVVTPYIEAADVVVEPEREVRDVPVAVRRPEIGQVVEPEIIYDTEFIVEKEWSRNNTGIDYGGQHGDYNKVNVRPTP